MGGGKEVTRGEQGAGVTVHFNSISSTGDNSLQQTGPGRSETAHLKVLLEPHRPLTVRASRFSGFDCV